MTSDALQLRSPSASYDFPTRQRKPSDRHPLEGVSSLAYAITMNPREKITLSTLMARKRQGRKFTMLTAYDYPTGQILESAGVETILVGDSAAQVVLGYDSTLPMKLDFMITIAAAVRRGAPSALLVGDMPYLSFNVNPEESIRNAGRFMAEAGCDCVKIEGDGRIAETVRQMSAATIPVMVHMGLRPQAVHQFGGYRAQGRDAKSAQRLIEDAKILEQAGACALLLEAVPPEPAKMVAESTRLPVIGCGAGPYCDGHVIVFHDMVGLTDTTLPRFVKRYADARDYLKRAVDGYVADIASGQYPATEHCYQMEAGEVEKLKPAAGNAATGA